MTQEEFRIKFSQAVAEDDTELFEMIRDDSAFAPYVELSNKGLDTLTNIAEVVAEPLFDEIQSLKFLVEQSKGQVKYWEDQAITLYFGKFDLTGEDILRGILKAREERIIKLKEEISSLRGKLSFYEENL